MPAANPMSRPREKPEKLAYWFLRLNGCTTIENFVIHPDDAGSQRTDVDILGVRFPHRSELLTSEKPMHDHPAFTVTPHRIQIIFTEVKGGNRACDLNGPWTAPEKENMHRVLYAIGAFPAEQVPEVATRLYQDRLFDDGILAVRLFAIGARHSQESRVAPPVIQLTWDDILQFVHQRMVNYPAVKSDHSQWEGMGRQLYRDALRFKTEREAFVTHWKDRIGVASN